MHSLVAAGLLAAEDLGRFLRRGHFAYEGGDHGDAALALELLFADPRRLQRAATELARRLEPLKPSVVCGPLVGGAFVAQLVAAELGARFVYAERIDRAYVVPRELCLGLANERCAVVDDVVNAGSATHRCMRALEGAGAGVVGVGCLAVRKGAEPALRKRLGLDVHALATIEWTNWPADACPLCDSGVTLFSAG
jgi:orotate phosphoribosyltransferase